MLKPIEGYFFDLRYKFDQTLVSSLIYAHPPPKGNKYLLYVIFCAMQTIVQTNQLEIH